MIARAEIVTWPKGAHGNTYGGNPIACAAALATIKLLKDGLVDNAAQMGEYIMDALAELKASHPSIGDVRGKGLMIGMELVKDPVTKEPAIELRDRVLEEAFQRGLILLGCGDSTIRLAPPLTVNSAEIDEALLILEEALYVSEGEGQAVVA
jgi:4-aminobutyrate aminotransferase